MHHCVNALHRPPEPVLVAHVPDEVAELGVVARWKALGHLVLLELVSGVDDHPGDPWVFFQDDFNELLPEGAGAPVRSILFVIKANLIRCTDSSWSLGR